MFCLVVLVSFSRNKKRLAPYMLAVLILAEQGQAKVFAGMQICHIAATLHQTRGLNQKAVLYPKQTKLIALVALPVSTGQTNQKRPLQT